MWVGSFIGSAWRAGMRTGRRSGRTAAGVLFTCAALACPAALAGPISIASYDVGEAVLSGHGNWAHVYTGKIEPGFSFVNFSALGTTAAYTGGGGTLNDAVIGKSVQETQLFVAGNQPIHPRLSLILDPKTEWHIERVEIYGGDFGNFIPGALTGLSLALEGSQGSTPSIPFLTTAFATEMGGALVNDLVDLSGTDLKGKAARTVLLSDFQGTFENWFSITEIRVYGTPVEAQPIPLPGTLWLLVAAFLALPFRRVRQNPA
jgi:hypothetical protein